MVRKAKPSAATPSISKIDQVLSRLRTEDGASLAELCVMTDWQPHTMRAALTSLRKKGHIVGKANVDGINRYTVAADAGQ